MSTSGVSAGAVGATASTGEPAAEGSRHNPATPERPPSPKDSSTASYIESVVVQLKDQLALEAQRETLTTSVSSAYHRAATSIIGNLKA